MKSKKKPQRISRRSRSEVRLIRQYRDSFPVAVGLSGAGSLDLATTPVGSPAESPGHNVQPAFGRRSGSAYPIARHLREREDHRGARTTPRRSGICRNTVAQAMREMGLKSRVSRLHTDHDAGRSDPHAGVTHPGPGLTAEAPNLKRVTDITYLPTAQGWATPGRRARLVQSQGGRLGDRQVAGDGTGEPSALTSQ